MGKWSSRSTCPSASFVQCTKPADGAMDTSEGRWCTIPSEIHQGYISYGGPLPDGKDSRWTLTPFSNHKMDGTDLITECSIRLGGYVGVLHNSCCYVAHDTPIGFDLSKFHLVPNTLNHDTYRDERRRSPRAGVNWSLRYGHSHRFTYRVIGGKAPGGCNPAFMGDSSQ